MRTIGITGNIGSGKSWVCSLFEAQGIPVFYSDEEAKRLYFRQDIRLKMTGRFGDVVYLDERTLNKPYLSQHIFTSEEDRRFVEQTLYPALNQHFRQWAERQAAPYVLYESAIIFEKGLRQMFDAVIMVAASKETRLRRVMLRDQCSEEDAMVRMKAQWDESKKISMADFVIYHQQDNEDGSLLEQIGRIDKIIRLT